MAVPCVGSPTGCLGSPASCCSGKRCSTPPMTSGQRRSPEPLPKATKLDPLHPTKNSDHVAEHWSLISGRKSHQDHAAALAKLLTEAGVPIVLHAVTDGRDTPPRSSSEYVERLKEAMPRTVTIATVSGRYYATDRDKRWERVEKAYRALVDAEGPRFPDAQAAIAHAYENGVSDEFIIPTVIGEYRGM